MRQDGKMNTDIHANETSGSIRLHRKTHNVPKCLQVNTAMGWVAALLYNVTSPASRSNHSYTFDRYKHHDELEQSVKAADQCAIDMHQKLIM